MPIGNLTSQYFADHYARETLQLPANVRYMDDMVLWHDDKSALIEAGRCFQDFIWERLQQELKPFCLNINEVGLPFLGYMLYPGTTQLAQRSRKLYIQKIKKYQSRLGNGLWTQIEFQSHATPLMSFTEYADAKAFPQKVHASMGV